MKRIENEKETDKIKKVFLFSPAYNVSEQLPTLLRRVEDLVVILEKRGVDATYLLIDDASQDETLSIAQEFAENYSWLTVKHNKANQGVAKTLLRGFNYILSQTEADQSSAIGLFDSDGEHNPLDVRIYLEEIEKSRGKITGVVGSIIYPHSRIGWVDMNMMRFLGALQAELIDAEHFYIQSPGFQLHLTPYVRTAVRTLLPRYRVFFEENFGPFPRWGLTAVIDVLMTISGAKIKSVYLGCFGKPPNRSTAKREEQALAALTHQRALRLFVQQLQMGRI